MKYKYKIGDKVRMIAYTQFMPKHFCEPYFNKTLIVTARTKSSVLGNEYEVTNPKNDDSIAWVNEVQLKFEPRD